MVVHGGYSISQKADEGGSRVSFQYIHKTLTQLLQTGVMIYNYVEMIFHIYDMLKLICIIPSALSAQM